MERIRYRKVIEDREQARKGTSSSSSSPCAFKASKSFKAIVVLKRSWELSVEVKDIGIGNPLMGTLWTAPR